MKRILLLLIAFALPCSCAWAQQSVGCKAAYAPQSEADTLYSKGDHKAAEAAYRATLAKDASDGYANYGLVWGSHRRTAFLTRALRLRTFLDAHPGSSMAETAMEAELQSEGDLTGAYAHAARPFSWIRATS